MNRDEIEMIREAADRLFADRCDRHVIAAADASGGQCRQAEGVAAFAEKREAKSVGR